VVASRKQLVAVNRTIESSGLDPRGPHALAVEFAQGMARKVDAAGGIEAASMDLVKAYQSAAKDLQRAVSAHLAAIAPKRGRDVGEASEVVEGPDPSQPPQLHAVEESHLARLRREEAELEAERRRGNRSAG
jgi:hypothetical protein